MKAILTLGVVKNPHESHVIQQIKITKRRTHGANPLTRLIIKLIGIQRLTLTALGI